MFKIKNEAQRATVYIYGTIGEDWWSPEDENRAKEFAQTLDALSPKPVDIRIDSCGGDVYEGFAIASAIQRYEGETHVYVDGIAASAASYIALMADAVTVYQYSMIMIHNAWCITAGNAEELRDDADKLDALDKTIAGIIAARSGMDLDDVLAAMAAETWYTADEAVAAGMADELVETESRFAASIDRELMARYRNAPASVSDHGDECPTCGNQGNGAEDGGEGAVPSHAASNIRQSEGTDAEGAFLLGNRVYRKENRHEDQ